jgi:hypothetical protein
MGYVRDHWGCLGFTICLWKARALLQSMLAISLPTSSINYATGSRILSSCVDLACRKNEYHVALFSSLLVHIYSQ